MAHMKRAERAALVTALREIVIKAHAVSFAHDAPMRDGAAYSLGWIESLAKGALRDIGEQNPLDDTAPCVSCNKRSTRVDVDGYHRCDTCGLMVLLTALAPDARD